MSHQKWEANPNVPWETSKMDEGMRKAKASKSEGKSG
jgi:hypothetical protein